MNNKFFKDKVQIIIIINFWQTTCSKILRKLCDYVTCIKRQSLQTLSKLCVMESCETTTLSPNFDFSTFPVTSEGLGWQSMCSPASCDSFQGHFQLATTYGVYQCLPYTAQQRTPGVSSPASSTDIDLVTDFLGDSSPFQLPYSPTSSEPQFQTARDLHHTGQSSPTLEHNIKSNLKIPRVKRTATNNKPYRQRTSSPVFPERSVPISAVTSRSNTSPTKAKLPINIHTSQSTGTQIDSSIYFAGKTGFLRMMSDQEIDLTSILSAPKSPLFVKLQQHQHIEQLKDIEKKLLKLYSEKARLFRVAQDTLQLTATTIHTPKKTKGSLHLSILPTGKSVLDHGFIEEANTILLSIGGLYSSFETAVEKIISLCSSAQSSISDITDCFPYIRSLLSDKLQFKLQEIPASKFVQIECKPMTSSSTVPTDISPCLLVILEALNQVMKQAQLIQQQGTAIDSLLASYQKQIQHNVDCLEQLCAETNMETRGNIRTVLTGNLAVLGAMQQIWQQHYRLATETVSSISESLTSL